MFCIASLKHCLISDLKHSSPNSQQSASETSSCSQNAFAHCPLSNLLILLLALLACIFGTHQIIVHIYDICLKPCMTHHGHVQPERIALLKAAMEVEDMKRKCMELHPGSHSLAGRLAAESCHGRVQAMFRSLLWPLGGKWFH